MPHNRFFIDDTFEQSKELILTGDEAHHLRVMRLGVGDVVELVNGCHALAQTEIVRVEKKEIFLRVIDIHIKQPSSYPIILCQALPRLNRLDTIVEKATELGATEIWLFPGDLSEKKSLSENQLERLHAITIASMKQCGRLDLPKIVIMPPLKAWILPKWPLYFGDLDDQAPPLLSVLEEKGGLLFCVGPESGFSQAEQGYLRKLKGIGVNLHQNTLRTDTASIVALSLISSK